MAPSTKNGWIKWRAHPAREIIMQDLNYGGFLHGETLSITDLPGLFELYKVVHPEYFSEIVFDQFKARMKDYMKDASERREKSQEEELAMQFDRKLNPQLTENARG